MNIKQKLIKEFFENYIDRSTGKIYLLDKAQLQPKLEQLLDDYEQQVSVEPEVKPEIAEIKARIEELERVLRLNVGKGYTVFLMIPRVDITDKITKLKKKLAEQ